MGYGGAGGGSGSIASSSDVSLSNPADSQVLSYNSSTAKWRNVTLNLTGGGNNPGYIYFDDYFSGSTDDQKIAAMNNWVYTQSPQAALPSIIFAPRAYTISTPIKLFSGLTMLGANSTPSRYSNPGTTIKWTGASGTSLFIFPPEGQHAQSYPTDGSPRDIMVANMQLFGNSTTHVFPKLNVDGSDYQGHTLWFCLFYNLTIQTWSTIWWGYGDGTCFAGFTDISNISDTAFVIGGSENRMFGSDYYSQANMSDIGGKPFMISRMAKSYIGNIMFTSRKSSFQLKIDGGNNMVIDGVAFDAQSSDPVYGAGLQISGGSAITVTNCSFKGMATNPASGGGGSGVNRGWVDVSGGDQITFVGNNFQLLGNNIPATSYPLLYADASLPAGAVKWGFNNYTGFGTDILQLTQGATGKIVVQTDPRVHLNG